MATRSTINLIREDNTVESIYCHWDGYPSNNGILLFFNYKTLEDVEKLMALGSLSSLAESPEKPQNHNFDKPVEGFCVAYGRDRGESDTEKRIYKSIKEIDGEEFDYAFKQSDNTWYLVDGNNKLKPLSDVLQHDSEAASVYNKLMAQIEKTNIEEVTEVGVKRKVKPI